MISRPASSGSSLSISCNSAVPPPNNCVNRCWKWLVDLLEGGKQPLARLAVEALDAKAQLLDRLDQIVALGGERGVLGLDLAQFLLGAQVDRAQPLALAPQPFELLLDLGEIRQRFAVLDLGELGDARMARSPACRGFRGRYRKAGAWRLRNAPRRGRAPRAPRSPLPARRGRRGRPRPARFRPLAGGRRRRGARLPPSAPRRSGPAASRRKAAARSPARRGRAWPRRCASRAWRSGCARRRGARSSRCGRRRVG